IIATHDSVTYNTAPMTKITEVTGASDRVSIWKLVNPATGTNSVVVTLSAAATVKGGATSWTNVDQTTPVGTAATNTGSSNFPSVTVASAAEEVVHDTIGANADSDEGAVTADAGQTERWNIRTSHTGGGSTEVGAASVTMSWTMVKNTGWASAGVPIKPAHVFTKLQLLVPGETAAPGTVSGKTGTPTARTAGVAFTVTVNAVDANWNVVSSTDTVGITSSDSGAGLPGNAALVAGTKNFSVTLNTAGNWTVTASDITTPAMTANTSPSITVPGTFVKLQLLVPGETAAPGTGSGKTGTPNAQTAGTAFLVTVNAVDANWNVMSSTHTVGITSTDTNATLPANAPLVSGTKQFSVTLNTVGTATVTATDITDGSKTASTSPSITVNLGAFTKLQLLVPGETAAPGTASSGSGKTGTPTARSAGSAFTVTVNAVDAAWNVVSTVTDTVGITSSGTNATLPANAALSSGTKQFSVTLNAVGTPTVTASDITDTNKTANTSPSITVNLGCAPVSDPSYVSANGQSGQATVYWASSNPVLILRKTAAFAGEKPTDGTTYTAGNTGGSLGTGVVQFVGSATELLQTSLANATTYYYKVFANAASCY